MPGDNYFRVQLPQVFSVFLSSLCLENILSVFCRHRWISSNFPLLLRNFQFRFHKFVSNFVSLKIFLSCFWYFSALSLSLLFWISLVFYCFELPREVSYSIWVPIPHLSIFPHRCSSAVSPPWYSAENRTQGTTQRRTCWLLLVASSHPVLIHATPTNIR